MSEGPLAATGSAHARVRFQSTPAEQVLRAPCSGLQHRPQEVGMQAPSTGHALVVRTLAASTSVSTAPKTAKTRWSSCCPCPAAASQSEMPSLRAPKADVCPDAVLGRRNVRDSGQTRLRAPPALRVFYWTYTVCCRYLPLPVVVRGTDWRAAVETPLQETTSQACNNLIRCARG